MGTEVNYNLMVVTPEDVPGFLRRQELREIALALMRQRVVQAAVGAPSSTVMGPGGTSYGTAKNIVADAKLLQNEMDKVAPL